VVAFGFVNLQGFGTILSRKGCLLACLAHPLIWVWLCLLVLTCWTQPSIWVRLRLFLVPIGVGFLCPLFLFLFQTCWDLQVSRSLIFLHSLLERAFTPAACSGGCWHLGLVPCWRLIHSLRFELLLILPLLSLFTFFCNLVSRPYAGSLGYARDECLYC
jgi:hypothetical protein